MANNLTANPKYIDTAAGSTLSGVQHIQMIQWIDEAGDVADGEDLSMTINGVTIVMKYKLGSDVGQQDIVLYQAGPFAKPIPVEDFVVNVIDDGAVLVWVS